LPSTFVHLRVHSDYTLGLGASKVGDLFGKAARLGHPALAITDRRNLHGGFELSKYADKTGVQPIVATEVFIQASRTEAGSVLLLAQDETGYANVCRILNMSVRNGGKIKGALDSDGVRELTSLRRSGEDVTAGIIAIAGTAELGYYTKAAKADVKAADEGTAWLARLFPGRFYIEICRNGFPTPEEVQTERAALELAVRTGLPIVATTEVWYTDESRHDAYEILKATGGDSKKILNYDDHTGLESTTERRYHMRGTEEMRELFADLPEALENAGNIARRCAFKVAGRKPILPPFPSEGGRSEAEEMRHQAREGLEARLDAMGLAEADRAAYRERLEFELGVIERMQFPGYFLIVADFIKWAKANGIPVGPGRGSGAGSVVAWALTITDLDPLRFGLLFERFLNPDRVSMPDFDVDFCQDRRDEVIRYVKDKYGSDKVAQIQTFMVIKSKTAIRDVARVLSTPTGLLHQMAVNELASMLPADPEKPVEAANLKLAYEMSADFRAKVDGNATNRAVYDKALDIEGLYRSSSMHAAGIVIGGQTLTSLVPVGTDPETGMPVVQFNMKDTEAAGLVKFDFLGLKTLSVIREALQHIRETTGEEINLSTLPYEDEATYAMLAEGRSNGVFQLESDGMKRVLRDIRPTCIEDLIAVVSLYRPGPMEMIPTYARRKNGIEETVYPEPADRTSRFLGETFGIMVYQEQVMQVAQVVAGYSLGEADLLRRAMGKKIASEMIAHKAKFCEGAEKNGTPPAKAAELFDLILKFASYGFNKSHAAAYAAIAFHTAYLKCHYPAQFFAALMTYETSEPAKMGLIKHDMDHFGIELLPPDVNRSMMRFAPEQTADGQWAVRFGLTAIKGVTESANTMLTERSANGLFRDVEDFHARAGGTFTSGQLQKLAEAGAFDCISSGNRARTLSNLVFLAKNERAKKDKHTLSMFDDHEVAVSWPAEELEKPEWPNAADREYEAVGFFFREHPLDKREHKLFVYGGVRHNAKIVQHMLDKQLADMRDKKLLGMVLEVERRAGYDGKPKIDVKLAEREDTYWISVYGREQDPDEALGILENAKRNRLPVVIKANYGTNKNGPKAYGRRVFTADEYMSLCNIEESYLITLDSSLLWTRIDKAGQERYRDIERRLAAAGEGVDPKPYLVESVAVFQDAFMTALNAVTDLLEHWKSDEPNASRIGIRLVRHAGRHSDILDLAIPGRYTMTAANRKVLGGLEAVKSIVEQELPPIEEQKRSA